MAIKKEKRLIPKEDIVGEYHRCQDVDVSIDGEAQRRGYAFQDLIYSVLKHEGLEPRTSYRTKGEEIDGSFFLSHQVYLLEAKWTKDPISASGLYSFKGKVDGKLSGTRGVFISMSGYSEDAPDYLTQGKQLNSVLFDQSDMDAIFLGQTTFTDVLDFKIRQAGETGKSYVPYKLPKTVQDATTIRIPIAASPTFGLMTTTALRDLGYGKTNVLLMCEGRTDALILETLFGRLLVQEQLQQDISLEIITMGGMHNWVRRLPEIINIKLNALEGHLDGVVIIMDSDFEPEQELNRKKSNILRSLQKIVFSTPVHVTFVKPDIKGWIRLDKDKIKSPTINWPDIKEKLDSIDIENNPELKSIAYFLKSLTEEDLPLWESDAIQAVTRTLEEVDWDYEDRKVVLYPRYGGEESAKVCRSLEELKYELEEIASIGSMNSMPFEGGEAVFQLDCEGIVEEILIDDYADYIKELGWEL